MTLNEEAWLIAEQMAGDAANLRLQIHKVGGATVIDCGIGCLGGLQVGLGLAHVCLSGRGAVSLVLSELGGWRGPCVQVQSDDPVRACLASQYAGWQIGVGKYFAMGSGPMRARYGKEELFNDIPGREQSDVAVGVLETRKLPTEEVIAFLAEKLQLPAERLMLLVAPTASIAGNIQIVARSLETALHKLHALKFDVNQVVSGFGTAPLPPPAKDDLAAIGRTNDAILYGGRVHLWLRCDDDQLAAVGPQVPASASRDHGVPFAELFARYNRDFYKIDPHLFAPAEVVFHNMTSGGTFAYGQMAPEVLRRSFEE
ncbi:MAG TPA: methenyltetrahydromethanopterin cyclohydrolase [Gemmataceae bacterium]|jgi:methenyltetrahydromethanopterin cyclohydrolase|nr:methenyltetrahydromethanopterin cyclohydrolase [Gemmataceae bacterium]